MCELTSSRTPWWQNAQRRAATGTSLQTLRTLLGCRVRRCVTTTHARHERMTGTTTKKYTAAPIRTNGHQGVDEVTDQELAAVHLEGDRREIRLADYRRDETASTGLDQCRDDAAERSADHHRNRQIDDIATKQELPESLPTWRLLLRSLGLEIWLRTVRALAFELHVVMRLPRLECDRTSLGSDAHLDYGDRVAPRASRRRETMPVTRSTAAARPTVAAFRHRSNPVGFWPLAGGNYLGELLALASERSTRARASASSWMS